MSDHCFLFNLKDGIKQYKDTSESFKTLIDFSQNKLLCKHFKFLHQKLCVMKTC